MPGFSRRIRNFLIAPLLLTAFFSAHSALAQSTAPTGIWSSHVKGIGGVFFKVDDPEKVNSWYQEHFGMDVADHGYTFFLWRDYSAENSVQRTVWTTFPKASEHFGKADQQVMINYIVDDLDAFLAKLTAENVEQIGEIEDYEYGRFAWIKDVEGNKVELWQPPSN